MDPDLQAAINRLSRCMSAPQIMALADAIESLQLTQGGTRARGSVEFEQGAVKLTVKGGRVRFLEVSSSRDIGRLDAEVPVQRVGRV